ncbi:EamA family transporter [Halobaculum sp. MBLA0147]|uniref:EamA family transporter n=1 Tax=Halobaculum sp. MBLA0147 TaxID=3079934 RepID=UPI0035257E78
MNYLPWAVVALVAYSFVPPLLNRATTGAGAVPSNVAALVSNGILVIVTLGVIAVQGESVVEHVRKPEMAFVAASGLFLAVGILSYYRALSLGPVSVVTPVFGMFLVLASVVGVALLNESLTARKVVGIGLAVLAVVLVAGD